MSWGKPDRLSHLLRDSLSLRLTCPCGHVAMPDVLTLRSAIWNQARCTEALAELGKALVCGQCGRRDFTYELVPQAPKTAAGP